MAIFAKYCQILYICIKETIMDYRVQITPLMKKVSDVLVNECVGVNLCIVQQPKNLIVEVSRSEIEQTVLVLKKHFQDVVDIRKAYPMIEDLHDFILVKPFISEAPVFQEEGVPVPAIEKLMVDRISDKEYRKSSLEDSVQQFQKTMEEYSVNTSRLLRYAARKGQKEEVEEILSKIDKGRLSTVQNICRVLATAPVLRAWVFGSFARMEEKPESDIDILVTLDKTAHMGLMAFSGLVSRLEEATGRPIDLVPEESLKPYARQSVERDKYLVYERA